MTALRRSETWFQNEQTEARCPNCAKLHAQLEQFQQLLAASERREAALRAENERLAGLEKTHAKS